MSDNAAGRMEQEVAVVMVPFQAQGHLNQLLQLACLISSSYGLPVYYLGLGHYNHQVKLRANALNPRDIANIRFHDLPTPPENFAACTTPPPVPNAIDIPIHIQSVWNSCLLLREPIESFLKQLSFKSRRVVVVHDTLMCYAVQDVSSFPNMESYIFTCISCFDWYCTHLSKHVGMPIPLEPELLKRLPSDEGCIDPDWLQLARFVTQYEGIKSGSIHNTSHVIEGSATFIDLLAQIENAQNHKQWAIGPVLQSIDKVGDGTTHYCLDWLNKQPAKSVLYVCFGTSTTFSDEQIKELAVGLEHSKQKFIWVLRKADEVDPSRAKSSSRIELPEGFEKRVEGVGLVVREWAPQPEILAHLSTGGYMSHCGWNSCLESITMGVAIATWPMHGDQPKNGFLITELLKIGLPVREWVKRDELVSASTIEKVVRSLMISEEGDAIRKRAQELGEAVRRSTHKGGAAQLELDSFIAHITR